MNNVEIKWLNGNCVAMEEARLLCEQTGIEFFPTWPTLGIYNSAGRLGGVAQVCQAPLVFTTWDTSTMQGRPFVEAAKALINWAKIQYGKCMTVNHEGSPVLPHMKALGLHDDNMKVYWSK